LRNIRNSEIIEKALEMIGNYEMSDAGWPEALVKEMAKILRDEA
jgi:hypothetical protein